MKPRNGNGAPRGHVPSAFHNARPVRVALERAATPRLGIYAAAAAHDYAGFMPRRGARADVRDLALKRRASRRLARYAGRLADPDARRDVRTLLGIYTRGPRGALP